jgi:threonine/homoserine/homoserine lactone efflux protein
MLSPLLGALATAGVLGVTHAIEPDHVAGISSVTSDAGSPRLSALVGACFSAGHVVLVVAWLAVGYLALGLTEYPPVFDVIGTAGVALLLGVLGVGMTIGGLRTLRYEHDHDGGTEPHTHLPLPIDVAAETTWTHCHEHSMREYLETGILGALFTLSPPVSMILFASTLMPNYGVGVIGLAVLVYAIGITATMSLIGAGVGTAFGATAPSPRAYGALRSVAGVVVVGFAAWTALGMAPLGLA